MLVIENFLYKDTDLKIVGYDEDCNKELYSQQYTSRGKMLMDYGFDASAMNDFNRAIELHPDNSDAYNHRARCYAKQGFDASAMNDFNRAIELNPDYAAFYYHRGRTYLCQGDDARARTDFNKAIELHPDDPSEYDKTILVEVTIDYKRIIELHPNDSDAYYSRGNAYLRQRWAYAAIDDYDKALELDPESAAYYRTRIDRLIEVIDRLIELKPNHPLHYRDRGDAYLRQGDTARAIDDYDRALELSSETTYYRERIDKAIELHPYNPLAYYSRGNAYLRQGDTARAITDYYKAIELTPG